MEIIAFLHWLFELFVLLPISLVSDFITQILGSF